VLEWSKMKTNNKDFSDRHLNNFSILVLAVAITMLTVVAANAQVDFNVLNELLGPTQTN
jgi:uncharacterized membrane protein